MQKDINPVDFDRLRQANDCLYAWSSKFGVNKREFLRFAFRLDSEASARRCALSQHDQEIFDLDIGTMLYAKEVEDALVCQYTPMVHSIVRGFTVSQDEMEDHVAEGLIAVRCAVWHYRTHGKNANFTTFCHHSISKRIKWYRSKSYTKRKRRAKRAHVTLFSDLSNDRQVALAKAHVDEGEFSDVKMIEGILKTCGLNEEDGFLLRSYMARQDSKECWFSEYNKRYRSKSRQGIHYHLHRVQRKVYYALRQCKLLPDGFDPPEAR